MKITPINNCISFFNSNKNMIFFKNSNKYSLVGIAKRNSDNKYIYILGSLSHVAHDLSTIKDILSLEYNTIVFKERPDLQYMTCRCDIFNDLYIKK